MPEPQSALSGIDGYDANVLDQAFPTALGFKFRTESVRLILSLEIGVTYRDTLRAPNTFPLELPQSHSNVHNMPGQQIGDAHVRTQLLLG
ncbi:uncharacterized protein SEPMUDRAFT_135219 [Sphaerulina musiva SO2202]|uniref:Uncharacterized protein n=1 Tax=Sphaerulina musiva (strain SO2202) TaxID=692275 RepID=M3AUM0_SPHMS|nr:uncharacterized protein SEPMUDRAFT_135219 [Sphaerulina musiva SO2202]EMF09771.1 hypothetical protein SEPMUDRAFT_135219 [Sphaerulina musiva SO2202]